MYKRIIMLLFLSACIFFPCIAQDTTGNDGFTVYYYPGGNKSSEGYMVDGKPDGYWKTFYEDGVLKSEGNRKDFLLDSTWKFYNDSAELIREINYSGGKKNGYRKIYLKEEIIEEYFVDDVKNGWTKKYYPEGTLRFKVLFTDGSEEGIAWTYAADGTVITLTEYRKGYIMKSENINRYRSGLKHGKWKTFYEDEKLRSEGTYYFGKKDGYFKEFDRNGNLTEISKYANDIEVYDAPELFSYEIRKEYYRSGKLKSVTSYKDDIPEGVRREYDQQGNITQGYIYRSGMIAGIGIIDESGMKQGLWKEFHDTGELHGEGNYLDGKRQNEWNFYYKNGQLEQSGRYNNAGLPHGPWKWYHDNGNIKREENLVNGIHDGPIAEFSETGQVILKGQFITGEEDGQWVYELNDYRETGSYEYGKREGLWKGFKNEKIAYEGNFIENMPDGLHIYYWENGKVRLRGRYISGKKEGDWYYYDEDGLRSLTIGYLDGEEIAINGMRIDSKFEK
jgi:uncharacterized protein